MSEENTGSVKCAVCGRPCDGEPHARDTKGRTICRECMEKKKVARSARDTGGADVMAGLLSTSKVANSTPCPNCKSYMAEGTSVCTHCGYNAATGKAVSTRVYAAPKEKGAKSSGGGGMSFDFDPMMGVWAMAAVYTGLAIGSFAVPALAMALIGVLMLHWSIAGIWLLVVMVMDGDLLWVLVSFIPLVGFFLLLYYLVAKCERPVVRSHYVLALIFAIVTGALAPAVLPDDAFAARVPAMENSIRYIA